MDMCRYSKLIFDKGAKATDTERCYISFVQKRLDTCLITFPTIFNMDYKPQCKPKTIKLKGSKKKT